MQEDRDGLPSILNLDMVISVPHLFLGKQVCERDIKGSSPFHYKFSITAVFGMDGLGVEIGYIF